MTVKTVALRNPSRADIRWFYQGNPMPWDEARGLAVVGAKCQACGCMLPPEGYESGCGACRPGYGYERVVDDVVLVIEITDVSAFLADLPDHFKPATPARPTSGLPRNVWVGGRVSQVWPEILDVRSRIRFLTIDKAHDLRNLNTALAAWRCSNCGHRGIAPRPERCPHANFLCGEAKILPQIDWIIDRRSRKTDLAGRVHKAGALYWPEEIPNVR